MKRNLLTILFLFQVLFSIAQPLGNRGLYFDGEDDYVNVAVVNALKFEATASYTVEAWVKWNPTSTTGISSIAGIFDGGVAATWALHIDNSTGKLVSYRNASPWTVSSTTTLEKNKWYHVATSFNGSNVIVYINGIPESNGNIGFFGTLVPSTPLMIGARLSNGIPGGFFSGQMDDVRIYNSARTQTNIQNDMTSTNVNSARAYWNFDESNGTIATNIGTLGTAANGTLTNGPLWALRTTNTLDDGIQGSLRWAIIEANKDTDQDYLDFSILSAAPWTIGLSSNLPNITYPIIFDGSTQYGFSSSNLIVLDGIINSNVNAKRGLYFTSTSSNSEVYGFEFTNFQNTSMGNQVIQILSNFVRIGGVNKPNVINNSGNYSVSIYISGNNCIIENNLMGTNSLGSSAKGPCFQGIRNYGNDIQILNNLFAGHSSRGVESYGKVTIKGNKFGTDLTGSTSIPNSGQNIILFAGSDGSIVGGTSASDANIIANSQIQGVAVSAATNCSIRGNNIYGNNAGILLSSNGNNNKVAPIITAATTTSVSGTCASGDVIEVFSDSPQSGTSNQGRVFLGIATVVGTTWTYPGTFTAGTRYTATATDETNGTSGFSSAMLVAPYVPPTQPVGNRGLYFDGVDDYVNVPNNATLNFTTNVTLEAWVKPSDIYSGGGGIICKRDISNNGYRFSILDKNTLVFTNHSKFDYLVTLPTSLEINKWTHLSVSYDGTTAKFYVNGNLEATKVQATTGLTTNTSPFVIGAWQGYPTSGFFKGQLDDIRVYNRILTDIDIKSDMASTAINQTGLVAYWNFEDDAPTVTNATVVKDLMSGNNGTRVGGPLWALRVTDNINDAETDQGTLRWAIVEANKDNDQDYIDFSIQQDGSISVIQPLSTISVTQPVYLDGYSAFGSSPNTGPYLSANNAELKVELDFVNKPTTSAEGIVLNSNSTIKGLSIVGVKNNGLDASAVRSNGGNNKISGNWIGLHPDGSPSKNMNGIVIVTTGNNIIGWETSDTPADYNIISNTDYHPILSYGGSGGNKIQGNYIGTDKTGAAKSGSTNTGIDLRSANNTLQMNVLAFTNQYGINQRNIKNNIYQNSIFCNVGNTASGILNAPAIVTKPTLSGSFTGTTLNLTIGSMDATGSKDIYLYKNTSCGANQGETFVAKATTVSGVSTYTYTTTALVSGDKVTAMYYSSNGSSVFSEVLSLCDNPLLVTSTADDSTCGTLRYAIGYANFKAGADTIRFNISGKGPFTISLTKNIPSITESLMIDGRSQSGYVDNKANTAANHKLVIELDGKDVVDYGLVIKGNDVTVRSLSIGGFKTSGIYAESCDNVVIEGCFVGVRPNGTQNANDKGIYFSGVTSSSQNGSYVGGGGNYDICVVSGNNTEGIHFQNSLKASVINSFVGIGLDGNSAMGNGGYGILYDGSDNTNIGFQNLKNVIAGNGKGQILIQNTSTVNVLGNNIGVGTDGTTAIASTGRGIWVLDSKYTNIGSVASPNIIANNSTYGIAFEGSGANFNSIISNSIYDNKTSGIFKATADVQEAILAPVIKTAVLNGGGSATFTLSDPGAGIDNISFYADNGSQGQVFLAQFKKTTTNIYTLTAAQIGTATNKLSSKPNYTAIQTTTTGSSSEFSNAIVLVPLVTPTATAATLVTKTGFTANWSKTAASSYDIDISTSSDFITLLTGFPKTGITDTFYKATGLATNTVYYYRVRNTGVATPSNTKMTSTILPPGSGNDLTFNGVNNYVEIGTAKDFDFVSSSSFTVEAWVKLDPTSTGKNVIYSKRNQNPLSDGFAIFLDVASGAVKLNVDCNNNSGGVFISGFKFNEWNHIAVTYSESNILAYVNGVALLYNTNNSIASTEDKPRIGAYNNNADFFKGQIDEVKIWGKPLSQTEIQNQMCQKLSGTETGLLGYFRMDENAGALTENKAIGSTSDGTIIPAPIWGYSGAPIGDVSKSEYNFGVSNIPFSNTDKLTIDNFTIAADQGIQVYKVNEAPSQTIKGLGIDSLHLNSYFGVFPIGIAGFKVTYDYSNTNINGKPQEGSLTFANRKDNSMATWNKIANTTLDMTNKAIATPITPLLSGQNEIIGAFAPIILSAPTGLFAMAAKGRVILKWNKLATNTGFSKYYIYGGTSKNPTTLLDSTTTNDYADTSKTFTGLVDGTTYYFRIAAKSVSKTISAFSNEDAATPALCYGKALSQNGTTNNVTAPNTAYNHPTTALTLETWVKFNDVSGVQYILSKGDDDLSSGQFGLVLVNGNLQFHFNKGGGTGGHGGTEKVAVGFVNNTWYHIAGAWDGTTARLYIDGVLVSIQAFSGPILPLGQPLNFGRLRSDVYLLNGSLDDVRLWNYNRTHGEIKAAKDSTLRGDEPGLSALYPFDEPTGNTIAYDYSRYNNNATISSGTLGTSDRLPLISGTLTSLAGTTSQLTNSNAALSWTSATLSVATVSNTGLATAVALGKSLITSVDNLGCIAKDTFRVVARGAALDFDGADDIISVPDNNSLDLVNNFTLSAWVKTQDLSKKQRVFHKSGIRGYAFGMEAGGKLMFTSYSVADVFTPVPVVLVNTWTHIAVTYNSNVINFYVNGNLVHTQIVAMIFLANTSNLIIGSETGASFWNGQLDEVRLWSRALCEAEIKNSMYCDNLTFKTELVAQYSFNQGVAGGNNSGIKTAIDSSGNNNNGTLSNTFALSSPRSNWIDGSPVKSDSICKPIVLPTGTTWTWTGAESKDWFSPCNWDMLSVPIASSLVIIPGPTPNQAEIKGNLKIARCKKLDVTYNAGARLELFTNSGAKLEVKP